YIALLSGGLAALFGYFNQHPEAARGGQGVPPAGALQPLIYGFAVSVGYVFPVLLGALATTGEFRHETLTPTFLAAARGGE
ncbi:hypothetical protein ACC691_40745, partial [Rhizobium johnstonii]|uniref:hypothetical protein n=1 Tax=Rhizobium johnstonii TaxID=3019933 RepID=UPI003F969D1C